jgi:hypothetical protein
MFVEKWEGEMNPVLAGYFNKVFLSLFQRRSTEALNYIYARPAFLNGLLKYLDSKSLVEVLTKVLAFDKDITLDEED